LNHSTSLNISINGFSTSKKKKTHHISKLTTLTSFPDNSFFEKKNIFGTNNIVTKKSILKNSKQRVNDMKKKLFKIMDDNLLISKLKSIQEKNYSFFANLTSEAQLTYETNIDILFKEKMDKLNEINNKYNSEIYELKQDIEEENKDSKNDNIENNDSSLKLIFDNFIVDKNKEIDNLQNEYNSKIIKVRDKLNKNLQVEELEDRNIIYKNEIMENIRLQIEDLINPQNYKKVNFDINK